jgi:hypothetical protein
VSDYGEYDLVEHEFDDDDKCLIVVSAEMLFKVLDNSLCLVSNDDVIEVLFITVDSLTS